MHIREKFIMIIISLFLFLFLFSGCDKKIKYNDIYYDKQEILDIVLSNNAEKEIQLITAKICSFPPLDNAILSNLKNAMHSKISQRYPTYNAEFGYARDTIETEATSLIIDTAQAVVGEGTKGFSKPNMLSLGVLGILSIFTSEKKKAFFNKPEVQEIVSIYDTKVLNYIKDRKQEFFKDGCDILITDIDITHFIEHIFDKDYSRYFNIEADVNEEWYIDISHLEQEKGENLEVPDIIIMPNFF